jgi:ABC-type amino acid transport substrate-binding protein
MVFSMLASGRVDYAFANLPTGMRSIAAMGLSGKIEPLLSRSAMEGGQYVCFSKARISPSFVDVFSRALKQFKQTEAFQAIYRNIFRDVPPHEEAPIGPMGNATLRYSLLSERMVQPIR